MVKGEVILDKWQEDVMEHWGDLLLCTGRRVGKTFILGRKCIEAMVRFKKPVIVTSLTEDQAELIIGFALSYAEEKYPKLIGYGKHKPQLKKIWVNGVMMMARAVGNTGNSCRGFEGGILLVDEASRMPQYFWAAATPVILMTGGWLWLASTPAGKDGYFWNRFNEAENLKQEDARFKVFYTTTLKVINEREFSDKWTPELKERALKILEQEKKSMTKLEFAQEYEGLFMEDVMQFFPDELIKQCQTEDRKQGVTGGVKYYIGVDIGRLGEDESAFQVGEMNRFGIITHVENLITRKTRLTEPPKVILDLHERYKFKKIFIDSGGIGAGVLDILLDNSKTKMRVEGLDNSKRVLDYDGREKGILKTDLYWNLRYMMEAGKIKLLKDHNIFMSLKMIQYEEGTDSQGRKITKIFGKKGRGGDHIAEALTRLCWASKQKSINIFVKSIRT